MTSKIILTDADGCLFNWNEAFNNFMQENGYDAIPEEVDNYSVQARFGIEADVKMGLIKKFNHSNRIANLEPYADAKEYVDKLNAEGYKFIVITSLSEKSSICKHANTVNLLQTSFRLIPFSLKNKPVHKNIVIFALDFCFWSTSFGQNRSA